MEEILASIRRIIADDTAQEGKTPPRAPEAPKPAAPASGAAMSQADIDAMLAGQEDDDGVLELTEEVEPEPVAAPAGFRQVAANDVVFRDDEPAPAPAAPEPVRFPAPNVENLLSPATNAAVSAAFGSLASTMLAENSRTIEDLVREMLRPMLKAWLDDNLPGLVERMVRAEIERVSRGGR